jgi:hypothetical protein
MSQQTAVCAALLLIFVGIPVAMAISEIVHNYRKIPPDTKLCWACLGSGKHSAGGYGEHEVKCLRCDGRGWCK